MDAVADVSLETNRQLDLRDRVYIGICGFLQGLVFWAAYENWPDSSGDRAALAAAIAFTAVGGLTFQMACNGRHYRRLLVVSILTALPFAACAYWVWLQIPASGDYAGGDSYRVMTLYAAEFVALYALGPFVQIYQSRGNLRFPYHALFTHSWDNFFIAMTGIAHLVVLWVLLALWGGLFALVGIEFFREIFEATWFLYLAYPTAFAFGVVIALRREAAISTGRSFLLAVFRFLVPLLAFIGLAFLSVLPFTGLQRLWDTGHASAMLLSLVALTILFFNAVFEDGQRALPYNRPIRFIVTAAVAVLPIYVAMAGYAVALRVEQYGLTPQRFYGVVLASIGGLYAIGYSVAALRRSDVWMGLVPRVNTVVAPIIVVVALLVHTSVLDPLAWSASNQVRRLVDGRVAAEEFDFGYLRFELGRAGERAFTSLASLRDHPEAKSIRAGVEEARPMKRADWPNEQTPLHGGSGYIEPLGTLFEIPDGLAAVVQSDPLWFTSCFEGSGCYAFEVELDGDGNPEYCVGVLSDIRCYASSVDGWSGIGRLTPIGARGSDAGELYRDLSTSGATTKPSPYLDVQIGEQALRLYQ